MDESIIIWMSPFSFVEESVVIFIPFLMKFLLAYRKAADEVPRSAVSGAALCGVSSCEAPRGVLAP